MGFFSKLLARLSQNISALFIIAHAPATEWGLWRTLPGGTPNSRMNALENAASGTANFSPADS
jgi:hypothetical protein